MTSQRAVLLPRSVRKLERPVTQALAKRLIYSLHEIGSVDPIFGYYAFGQKCAGTAAFTRMVLGNRPAFRYKAPVEGTLRLPTSVMNSVDQYTADQK